MLKSNFYKSIVNIYFPVAILAVYIIMLFGQCGNPYNIYDRANFIMMISHKFDGSWVADSSTKYINYIDGYWPNTNYLYVVLPVLSCLPVLIVYLAEINTGNKRFVLSRTDKIKYYSSEIMCNLIVSGLIVLSAVILFEITIFAVYDHIDIKSDEFLVYFNNSSGWKIRDISEVKIYGIFFRQIKLFLFFALMSFKCSMFCKAIATITKDKYFTVGITVVLYYLQSRIYEEIATRISASSYDNKMLNSIGDIISPVFLKLAGQHIGIYKNQWIAVLVMIMITAFWIGIYIFFSEKNVDKSMA